MTVRQLRSCPLCEGLAPRASEQRAQNAPTSTFMTKDHRAVVNVYPGPPAYVYVAHDGLTEGEIDAILLELSERIPSPCCIIALPWPL
jgi:hypothetical protein